MDWGGFFGGSWKLVGHVLVLQGENSRIGDTRPLVFLEALVSKVSLIEWDLKLDLEGYQNHKSSWGSQNPWKSYQKDPPFKHDSKLELYSSIYSLNSPLATRNLNRISKFIRNLFDRHSKKIIRFSRKSFAPNKHFFYNFFEISLSLRSEYLNKLKV